MTRDFLDRFNRQKSGRFPKAVKPVRVSLVTGQLASPVLDRLIMPVLNQISGLDVELAPVLNEFYGGGVTVSGLLVGRDIAAELRKRPPADLVVLPPNCRNYDGIFLDGWDVPQLASEVNAAVFSPAEGFGELFTYLKSL